MAVEGDVSEVLILERSKGRQVPRLDEETIHATLDALPSGVVLVDPAGTIAYVNALGLSMFGYEATEDLLGRRLEVLVPDRFRSIHAQQRNEFAGNPHTRPMGIGLDLHARRSDGTEFQVEIGLAQVRAREGTYVVVVIADIGARKRAESAMRRH